MKFVTIFALLFCLNSNAQYSQEKDITDNYLKELSAPPAAGSKEDKAEIETVLKIQKARTADDCTRAESEVKISLKSYYGKPYGILEDAEVKHWEDFFEKASQESKLYVHKAKDFFKRERPYTVSKEVQPCIKKPSAKSFSYPSGHTSTAYIYAKILTKIYPAKSKEIMKRADQIAQGRVIGGVHYPKDIEGGKKIAEVVFKALEANVEYKRDFEMLKNK